MTGTHQDGVANQERNSCPRLQSCYIGSSRVGVSQSLLFMWYDQPCSIICHLSFLRRSDPLLDPTLAAFSFAVPCFKLCFYVFLDRRSF